MKPNFCTIIKFEEDSMLIATLLPYSTYHQFLFETIENDSMMKDKILDLTQGYIAEDGSLIKNYPDFLIEALTLLPPTETLERENPVHEMVTNHYANHMRENAMTEEVIQAGMFIWCFCYQMGKPSVTKLGPYAASIEYVVRNSMGR